MFDFLFEFGFLLLLPTIFVGISSLVVWSQLPKPWRYVFSCLLMLYVLYGLILYFTAPTVYSIDAFVPVNDIQPIVTGATEKFQEKTVWFPYLAAYLRPILLFSISAVPILWFTVKLWRK
jgi:hypothetical protein